MGFGFYKKIVNHGICENVLDDALSAAFSFFNLPTSEKMKLMCNDVHKPVRYGTSLKDGMDKVQFWRVFLKHYANPLEDWINLWPDNPSDYRYIYTYIYEKFVFVFVFVFVRTLCLHTYNVLLGCQIDCWNQSFLFT